MKKKKIAYDIGAYYAWDIDAPFDYKNFVVSAIGIDVLFKLCKGKESFYFTAYEEERIRKDGPLPSRMLFDEFYVSKLINMVLAPSEKEVIWSEPNYPEVGEAFKRKFGFMTVIENYYIEGTFLPPQYIAAPPALNPKEYPASEGYVVSFPLHIPFPVTREEFIEIASNHKAYGYGDPVGYYTKDRPPAC